MFALIQNNYCKSVSNQDFNRAFLEDDEMVVEIMDTLDASELIGKIYDNGRFIDEEKDELYFIAKRNEDCLDFLQSTDWKIARHREQKELGIETSMSDDDYQKLMEERQAARSKIIDLDTDEINLESLLIDPELGIIDLDADLATLLDGMDIIENIDLIERLDKSGVIEQLR